MKHLQKTIIKTLVFIIVFAYVFPIVSVSKSFNVDYVYADTEAPGGQGFGGQSGAHGAAGQSGRSGDGGGSGGGPGGGAWGGGAPQSDIDNAQADIDKAAQEKAQLSDFIGRFNKEVQERVEAVEAVKAAERQSFLDRFELCRHYARNTDMIGCDYIWRQNVVSRENEQVVNLSHHRLYRVGFTGRRPGG